MDVKYFVTLAIAVGFIQYMNTKEKEPIDTYLPEEIVEIDEVTVDRDSIDFVVYRDSLKLSKNLDYRMFKKIDSMALALDLPKDLIFKQINQESRFKPDAVSHVGARGIMQIMPKTFRWMKRRLKKKDLNIDNPDDNIYVGMHYMKYLLDRVEKDSPNISTKYKHMLALSSYNAGYSRRYRALRKYPETINYVDKILN